MALDDPDTTAALVAAEPMPNDDIDMSPTWNHPTLPLPLRYVFREIDFRIDQNGHLQFGFRNTGGAQPLNGRTIEEVVAGYRQAPAALSFDLSLLPESSVVSGLLLIDFIASPTRTPLDLQIWGDPIYIIYRFFKPRNITFSPDRKALSHKNGDAAERYGYLRHVPPGGQGSIDAVANCELIYFACAPKNVNPYQDGFNLRVQLEQEPHMGPPVEPRILDLEIDPDVRYPGGSVVDP